MNKEDRKLDQLVDQAIKDFPLDPVPEDLIEKVMRQVERSMPIPRLSFSWVDFSLSVLVAAVIGVFLEILQSINRSPYWSSFLRVELQLFWQSLRLTFNQNQATVLAGMISILTVAGLVSVLAGVYRWQTLSTETLSH